MQGSDGNVFAYDSFTRVRPRKKRKKKENATTPCDLLMRVTEELHTDGGWSLRCEELCREALRAARMTPRRVHCLGLGCPSSSRDARAQLALLRCLCAALGIDSADVSVYDPAFTDADKQLFHTLGLRCLDHAQGTAHSLDLCPTMLYMPHCDLALYETVIRANWTLEGLCNIVFLANRFQDYVDNNAASRLERASPCMLKLAPFVESRPVPTSGPFPGAFNSLAVQHVKRTPLSLQGDAFWESAPFATHQTPASVPTSSEIQNPTAYQQTATPTNVEL